MAHDCDDVTDSQCVHTVKVIFRNQDLRLRINPNPIPVKATGMAHGISEFIQ